jgi:radical SAM protein with 4Fe4S-binding SPASM domain
MKTWLQWVLSHSRILHNLWNSSAYRNYALNACERKVGKSILRSTPLVLQLELTTTCNLKCATCGHSHWDQKLNPSRYLDLSVLDDLTKLYASCSEVLIGGYGEPTLHPQFEEIIARIREDPYKKLSLISNGLLLEKNWSAISTLDLLILSLDGVGEVYEKHRGVPFSKLLEALDFFTRHREKTGLHINMVWNRDTHDSLRDSLRVLEKYPVEVIHLLPEKHYSSSRFDVGLFHLNNLDQLHLEIIKIQNETKILLQYPDFLSASVPCYQPFESIFVLASGEIMACCSAIFQGNDYRFSLGQVSDLKNSWHKLWNQEKLIQFRKAHFGKEEYPSPCNTCAFRIIRQEALERPLNG